MDGEYKGGGDVRGGMCKKGGGGDVRGGCKKKGGGAWGGYKERV